MPGGVCESTAFAMWGHTCAAVCLPMENYHNQGPRGRIAPERVNTDDFDSLVKLLVALAATPSSPAETDRRLRTRLAGLLAERGAALYG